VLGELSRMNVRQSDIVISTNMKTRQDGLPRSDQPNPSDPGVAVYWIKKGESKVMAIDHYARVADNLAAVAATLDAMRSIERHGGAQILERAFVGFDALPAPGRTAARGWREVLGVGHDERDLAAVRTKYQRLAGVHHPDKGGSESMMSEINGAWAKAQEELR
jgi:hypothetical protein